MSRFAIALGSNVGDRLGHLRAGVGRLTTLGELAGLSSIYETEPVGGPPQGRYLNAVAVLDTPLEPDALLSELLDIERSRGRLRRERWGPRTLDLDIVAWDGPPVDEPDLHIPHARAHERRFVLAPLVEVWPGASLAGGTTAAVALGRLARGGVRRWRGAWLFETPGLGVEANAWVAAQVVVLAAAAAAVATHIRPGRWWRYAVGGGLGAGGAGLGIAAVRALGEELRIVPEPRTQAALVERGPYRLVRHPIYGALILGFAGAAVVGGSVAGLAGAAGVGVFFRAKSAVEERALGVGVPGYDEYRHRVTHRFLPSVW